MKLLRESLNQNSVCQKHKANKHSTRKTIGCFAEIISCLYQFTNIKLKLKSLRIERMHTEVYTSSLLTKSYIQSSQKPLGNPLSNQPQITYNTIKEMTLIPSRHTLPLAQHNTTKNADLDNLKNTQHFSAIHTDFLSKYKGLHLLQKRSEINTR